MRPNLLAAVMLLAVAACGSSCDGDNDSADSTPGDTTAPSDAASDSTPHESVEDVPTSREQMFPDVVAADAVQEGSTWTISATLASPYDTPDRYADAWRAVGPDGTVFAERIITHDHANEQPFTRSASGIEIPDDVTIVTIEGRDLRFGYGGDTFELTLRR